MERDKIGGLCVIKGKGSDNSLHAYTTPDPNWELMWFLISILKKSEGSDYRPLRVSSLLTFREWFQDMGCFCLKDGLVGKQSWREH